MPKTITIFAAKLAYLMTRLNGHGGTALPGLVAQRLDPAILIKLVTGNFTDGITLITGTNGKTTTTHLATDILTQADRTLVYSQTGSNLERGIIATILQAANWRGQITATQAVFEVDENAFGQIAPILQPTDIVITNLFRDQLDRYGELDTTARKMAQAIDQVRQTTLHLNADDPLVASLASSKKHHQVRYFGVADYRQTKLDDLWSADSLVSPRSGAPLEYSRRFYGHIGHYRSSNGDFARPKPQLEAEQIVASEQKLSFRTQYDGKKVHFRTQIGGFYNIYNVLAALSLASKFKISTKLAQTALRAAQPTFGRTETINYKGHQLRLLLAKNPVGFNQTIENYLLEDPTVPLLIIINDNLADGRDVSWLWDADIEAIQHHRGPIVVSGRRAADMALRLKYANVAEFTTEARIDHALHQLVKQAKPKQTINIVPTYTAMLEMRAYLVKQTNLSEYWQ